MVKIPQYVDEWTIGMITDLLHQGYDESQILEFKESINQEGDRIAKTVCAFTNTNGGYIIFGIDSDRKKNYHERIIGVENTDQLKRQIIDKINNIQPHIPSEFLQFKKNNIPISNGNVVVILQVFRSSVGPHQYEHKFYKRLPDGNDPMNADEVKSIVINLQKNFTLFNLMLNEFGIIKDNYERAKELLDKDLIHDALTQCELTSLNSSQHFLYNQSYLYAPELQNLIQEIVNITQKLSYDIGRIYEENEEKNDDVFQQFLKQNNVKSWDEFMKILIQKLLDIILNDLDHFEKISGYKIPLPKQIVDLASINQTDKN